MSPEQAQTTGYVRPSSDQYSLGLVLFEMLTGKVYKRLEPRQAAALLAQQPAGVSMLVGRMTANDSGDRYETTADLVGAIEDVAHAPDAVTRRVGTLPILSDGITTRPETPRINLKPQPPLDNASQPPRHTRRAVLIGAGALVVAGGTVGLAAASRRGNGTTVVTATPQATTPAVAFPTAPIVAAAATSAPTAIQNIVPPATVAPTAVPTVAPTATPVPPTLIPPTVTPFPPTATPTLAPTATIAPKPGAVLYQADWSNGLNGWPSGAWKTLNGILINDGSENAAFGLTAAPYRPGNVSNYAVETEIQVVKSGTEFGIVARADANNGYWIGMDIYGSSGLATIWPKVKGNTDSNNNIKAFSVGGKYRMYRAELQGNVIRFIIDGAIIIELQDNRFLAGGQVGL